MLAAGRSGQMCGVSSGQHSTCLAVWSRVEVHELQLPIIIISSAGNSNERCMSRHEILAEKYCHFLDVSGSSRIGIGV